MFEDTNTVAGMRNAAEDMFGALEGGYRAPELQVAGTATKLVQGWSFSGYDCGYSTFYYRGNC